MSPQIPIAAAALVRDGSVLMVHRLPSRLWYPDCWDLVGGHIERGEPPTQAIERECFEELGIHVRDPHPIRMTVSDQSIDMHAFLITSWDGEPRNAAPEEHDDLRWFRPNEIAELKLADPASLGDILSATGGRIV